MHLRIRLLLTKLLYRQKQLNIGLGDGEALERYVELDGAGRSPEVNKEAKRIEFMSITGDARVGGREQENILHKLAMT